MNFSKRSYQPELLDAAAIPVKDLYRNLHELDVINHLLGGHAVTLKGLRRLGLQPQQTWHILDIGCGGGDTLKAIAAWGKAHGFTFILTGVDLKADCIAYAKKFCKDHPEISFIQSDYRDLVQTTRSFDIIITSLFCHHLHEEEISTLFSWCGKQARVAFIMNDLHRHALAYYSISWLTRLFSRSYLVKHDAKLSVLRGFKRQELRRLIPGGTTYTLSWCWAFRWLLVVQPAKEITA